MLPAAALLHAAADLSRGNDALLRAVEAALASPPRTTEEVGFYITQYNTDAENVFRFFVSQLMQGGYTMAAEDKYQHEIFEQWEEQIALPEALKRLLPEVFSEGDGWFDEDNYEDYLEDRRAEVHAGYVEAVRAIEAAFAETGSPLVTLEIAGGDTLVFMAVPPAVAERWAGVVLARTHDGKPLGVRPPDWDTFWHHLGYATGFTDGPPPPGSTLPVVWREA
ncbi:MAG: hypothetical protein AAF809_11325 [Bacteroidota bacterium]